MEATRLFQICAQVLPTLSNDALQFFPGTETPASRHRKSVAQVKHASHSKRADRRRAKTFSGQQTGRVRFSARRDAIPSCGNLPDAAAGVARLTHAATRNRSRSGEYSFPMNNYLSCQYRPSSRSGRKRPVRAIRRKSHLRFASDCADLIRDDCNHQPCFNPRSPSSWKRSRRFAILRRNRSAFLVRH
jgi:hypothetical protein